jgi:hypothetical protein
MAHTFHIDETARVGLLALGAALLGTFARLPYWRFPPDLKRADGSDDPRAGHVDPRKAIGELVGVPALTMIAAGIARYWHLDPVVMAGICAFVALLGSSFLISTAEKVVGPIATAIANMIPSFGRRDRR